MTAMFVVSTGANNCRMWYLPVLRVLDVGIQPVVYI